MTEAPFYRQREAAEVQAAVLLACSALLLICACANDIEKVKEITAGNTILEKGEGVVIQYSVQGILKASVIAAEVITYQADEPYMEFPRGVKLNFFDNKLDTTSRLTANYGVYYIRKEEMLVRDNVVIVNDKGEMLNTEELSWKRSAGKIYSDKFVRISTPEEIIYGTGFEAKEDFSAYTIKNISGTVQLNDERVR